jgi:hypothetical protein
MLRAFRMVDGSRGRNNDTMLNMEKDESLVVSNSVLYTLYAPPVSILTGPVPTTTTVPLTNTNDLAVQKALQLGIKNGIYRCDGSAGAHISDVQLLA